MLFFSTAFPCFCVTTKPLLAKLVKQGKQDNQSFISNFSMFCRLGTFLYFRHSSWKFSISHTTAQLNFSATLFASSVCVSTYTSGLLLWRLHSRTHLCRWKDVESTTFGHLSSLWVSSRKAAKAGWAGKVESQVFLPWGRTCRNSLGAQVSPSINFAASEHLLHFEVFHRLNGPCRWFFFGLERVPTGQVSK